MHRLEQRREPALGIEVGRRRDGDRAGARRAEIRQDVAEEIRRHHHVEAFRKTHEVRSEDVDVELVVADLRVAGGDRFHSLVPVRHGDRYAIRLGRRSQVAARPLRRQLEGEAHDAVDADARHHRLLDRELALGALEHAAADRRVLALSVLAHDHEVDFARRARAAVGTHQRRADARHQPARPQVDVLVELAPELQQRAPQRDVVGYRGRPADGAVEDRIMAADPVLPVGRHHLAVPGEVVAGSEVEVVEVQVERELPRRCLQHPHALGNGLLADAVTRNHGDPLLAHQRSPRVRGRSSGRTAYRRSRSTAARSAGGSAAGRRLARST